MIERSPLEDLHQHGTWANHKLLSLCAQLTDAQLDAPRAMGFGSLRNTCFHILEAERLWLERYAGKPWRPLQADAEGRPIVEIQAELDTLTKERETLKAELQQCAEDPVIQFEDLGQNSWSFPLSALQLHVANHGTHHRAQVLSFLRQFGHRVPGGADYLFYKLAYPSVSLPGESIAPIREYGLEVQSGDGAAPTWEPKLISMYLDYDTWATRQVLRALDDIDESRLDTEIEMGPGSLRKTLQHMLDANRWWLANWQQDNSPFPSGEEGRSLQEMGSLHDSVSADRKRFSTNLDPDSASRVVSVTTGGHVTRFRVVESLLQLASHGTHHRGQCLNMIRTLGGKPPGIDLIEWLRVGSP